MKKATTLLRALPRAIAPLILLGALGGCNMIVLNPAGDVATQQANLVVVSTILMLLVIIPVMALTVLFAWRYRQANKEARYEPEWDHSTQLEVVIWAAPLLIVIMLGAVTWVGTHLLDPYRPIARVAPGKPVTAAAKPLEVDVVALDWKWLFIYPEYGVASVNELAAPVNRPIQFRITSSSVMNSFYVPALAGQIYAMPGMETRLHAVVNHAGSWEGFSANYSGAGFSHMRFAFHGMSDTDFDQWIARARADKRALTRATYLQLEQPSEKVPVMKYGAVENELYDRIVNMCVEPGKMCMGDMMAIDARGGMGMKGIHNVKPLLYDKHGGRGTAPVETTGKNYVTALCNLPTPMAHAARASETPTDQTPLKGQGLPAPAKSQLAAEGRNEAPAQSPLS